MGVSCCELEREGFSRVKRKTRKTLTELTRERVIRACSRAPRLSTRCVEQTRWDEHTEPTGSKIDPCLLESAAFLHEMRGATEMNTLNRHGTDWIVFARGNKTWTLSPRFTPRCSTRHIPDKKMSLAINLVARPAIWGESGVSMMNPTPDPPYKISRNFKLQSCGPNLSWGAIKFVRLD